MRSPWKIQYFDPRVNRDSFFSIAPYTLSKKKKNPANAHTHLRGVRIPYTAVDKRVSVSTGNNFKSFIVAHPMVGHRFGEFMWTKKLGKVIHTPKKKKKKKKNKK